MHSTHSYLIIPLHQHIKLTPQQHPDNGQEQLLQSPRTWHRPVSPPVHINTYTQPYMHEHICTHIHTYIYIYTSMHSTTTHRHMKQHKYVSNTHTHKPPHIRTSPPACTPHTLTSEQPPCLRVRWHHVTNVRHFSTPAMAGSFTHAGTTSLPGWCGWYRMMVCGMRV